MKKLLLLLPAIALLTSCGIVETKESKMKKDVDKYIEISCSGDYSEMVRFSFELTAKYTEQEQVYFYSTLMNELKKRQQEGKSSGLLDAYLIVMDSMNELVNIRTKIDNESTKIEKDTSSSTFQTVWQQPDPEPNIYKSKTVIEEVECDDPYCCGE